MPEDDPNSIFSREQIDDTLRALSLDQRKRWSAMNEPLGEEFTPREWDSTFAEFLRRETLRKGATLAVVALSPLGAVGALAVAAIVGFAAGYAVGRRSPAVPSGWA